MPNISNLLAQFQSHMPAATGSSDRLMHPLRDWYVSLLLGGAVLLCLLLVSGYLYLSVSRGDLYVAEPNAPRPDVLDRSLLRETLLYFEGEAAEFSGLQTKPPAAPTPY